MKNMDWESIESDYITGNFSYAELAEKYKISKSTLAKYAVNNKWTEKRKKFRKKVVTKTTNKIAKEQSDKLLKLISASDNMAELIDKTVSKMLKAKDASPAAMKDIVTTLKDLTAVIRNLNDLPTLAERNAYRIAQGRLKLEKKKAEQDNNQSTEITVILGDAEDYAQ